MKVKFVYGVCPAFILYVDYQVKALNLKDPWGKAKGPVIRIEQEYKDNQSLLEHELNHVRQWYRHGLIIHTLLYRYSMKYREWAEKNAGEVI